MPVAVSLHCLVFSAGHNGLGFHFFNEVKSWGLMQPLSARMCPAALPSRRGSAMPEPGTAPAVTSKCRGFPRASQSMWIFVVSPPADRPGPCCFFYGRRPGSGRGPPSSPASGTHCLNQGSGPGRPAPRLPGGTSGCSVCEPTVGAVPSGKVGPRGPAAKDPEDRVDKQAAVRRRAARIARLARQQGRNPEPVLITDFITPAHAPPVEAC